MTRHIRSVDQLEAALTADLKWRVQEMYAYERLLSAASGDREAALLRGGLALLYAHWEGYVKHAGASFLEYVSKKGLHLDELRPELAAVALGTRLKKLAEEKNPESHTELVRLLRNEGSEPANLPFDTTTIRTHANLNFKLFASIMHSLGCDASKHAASSVHIDERLLGIRNEIAHGRREFVDAVEWNRTRSVVETILRDVRTQLANAAVLQTYRATRGS